MIRAKLKEESERPDHAQADAFMLFIMTHGVRDEVYGIHGKPVKVRDEIAAYFNGANCPALIGKPKLVFIQACQGGQCQSLIII